MQVCLSQFCNHSQLLRTKSCKNRNYSSKEKTANPNDQTDDKITDNENENDSERQPALQNAVYKIHPVSVPRLKPPWKVPR